MHRPAISLLPASKDDIPSLIRIHMAGFGNDNPTRLMFKSKDDYEAMLLDLLKAQLSDPKVAVTKAVSKDTGEILDFKHASFSAKMMTWRALQGSRKRRTGERTMAASSAQCSRGMLSESKGIGWLTESTSISKRLSSTPLRKVVVLALRWYAGLRIKLMNMAYIAGCSLRELGMAST